MALKKITDLTLISSITGTVNFVVDNGIQTYRASATQLKDFILSASSITRSMLTESERLPLGSIQPYALDTAPTGWLLCHGQAVSRTTYADLFAAVGTRFGEGDGSTTFNVPDFRGRFLRGLDDGAGNDPDASGRTAMNTGGATGDNIGSIQGDSTKRPNTNFTTNTTGNHTHAGGKYIQTGQLTGTTQYTNDNAYVQRDTNHGTAGNHSHSITGGGDAETRPINAYVNYIIKF